MTALKLTEAQRFALSEAIENGGFIYAVAVKKRVLRTLLDRGLLRFAGHCYRVTDAGRAALKDGAK